MSAIRVFIVVCLVTLSLAIPSRPSAQQAADVIGKVTRIQNAAVAMQDALPRPLATGSTIQLGDIISTGVGTTLEFELNDGSVVTLGERTHFVVLEFVMESRMQSTTMRVIEGVFVVASGAIAAQGGDMVVETHTATIGIRGTTVWGGILEDNFEVALLDGKEVIVSTRGGTQSMTVVGQGLKIESPDAAPTMPSIWSASKVARAKSTVAFSQ